MKLSTTGTVKRYSIEHPRHDTHNAVSTRTSRQRKRRTVQAICTAAGLEIAFRCQPFLLIVSPTASTFSFDPCTGANATTDAGGLPRTRNSGISARMRCAIVLAAPTMSLQDCR